MADSFIWRWLRTYYGGDPAPCPYDVEAFRAWLERQKKKKKA